jgi:shikimate dehydrogenase
MDKSNKHTYCVIGDPIEHSLSPNIHKFVFQNLGLGLDYNKVHVKPSDLKTFIAESRDTSRPGFNVTIPHKETIIPFLDEMDILASRIGAVNTIVNRKNKLIGYNTDVYGCRIALENGGWKTGKKVVLLGAGGAARAVIQALHLMHVSQVILYDLIPERCNDLKQNFGKYQSLSITIGSSNNEDLQNQLKDADLLINATPVGMWPNVNQSPLPDLSWLSSNATVFDLVPKPVHTNLLKKASARGMKTIPGLSMLIAQALAADEIWLQKKLPNHLFNQVWNHIHQTMDPS